MRTRALLAVLPSVFLTAGCLVPRHDSFATPHDAVLTFQSAFAHDDEVAEYACFANTFKREHSLNQQTWGLAREQVYAPLGMVGRCVLRHNGLADNLEGAHVLPARVELRYGLLGTELDIELVAEVEAVVSDGTGALLASWLVQPADLDVATDKRTTEGPEILLVLTGELREERVARIERGDAASLELRPTWRIAGVAPAEGEVPPPPASGATEPPGAAFLVQRLPAPPVVRLAPGLGVVKLGWRLPCPPVLALRVRAEGAAALAPPLRWEFTP